MPRDQPEADFLNLPTQWSVLRRAAEPQDGLSGGTEWKRLLEYYRPAVEAYLSGAAGDLERAKELFQEFAVQFLRGGFRHARQEKGPFRHYLKRALSNLVRREKSKKAPLLSPLPDGGPAGKDADAPDEAFTQELCRNVIDRSWAALRSEQSACGAPYFDVLRARAEHAEAADQDLATIISRLRGEVYTADRVRKILQRARHRFAELVYEQVANGLDDRAPDAVAEELADLKLLRYCSVIVQQRQNGNIASSG